MDSLEEQWWNEIASKVHPGQLRYWLSRFWAAAERAGVAPEQLDARFASFKRSLLRTLTAAIDARAKALASALARGARKEAEKAWHGEPLMRELELRVADALKNELGTTGLEQEPAGAGDALYDEWLQGKMATLPEPERLPVSPAVAALRAQPGDRAVRQVYIDSLLASGDPCGEIAGLMMTGRATQWRAELRLELDDSLGPLAWLPVDLYFRDGLANAAGLMGVPDGVSPAAVARFVLGHPLCAALEHLNLPLDRGQSIIEALRDAGPQPQLRSLHIADRYERESRVDLSMVASQFPGLETLGVAAQKVTTGTLELPKLKWLSLSFGVEPEMLAAESAQWRCGLLQMLKLIKHGYEDENGETQLTRWESGSWVGELAAALARRTTQMLMIQLPVEPEALPLLFPVLERESLSSFALCRRELREHARGLLSHAPRLRHLKHLLLRSGDAEPSVLDGLVRALPGTEVSWRSLEEALPWPWEADQLAASSS